MWLKYIIHNVLTNFQKNSRTGFHKMTKSDKKLYIFVKFLKYFLVFDNVKIFQSSYNLLCGSNTSYTTYWQIFKKILGPVFAQFDSSAFFSGKMVYLKIFPCVWILISWLEFHFGCLLVCFVSTNGHEENIIGARAVSPKIWVFGISSAKMLIILTRKLVTRIVPKMSHCPSHLFFIQLSSHFQIWYIYVRLYI